MNKSRSHMPWYEDLNPATDQTVSDWAILDLDTNSYNRDSSFAEEVWTDTVNTLW